MGNNNFVHSNNCLNGHQKSNGVERGVGCKIQTVKVDKTDRVNVRFIVGLALTIKVAKDRIEICPHMLVDAAMKSSKLSTRQHRVRKMTEPNVRK